MLNDTQSLTKLKRILDDPGVYKYEDITHTVEGETGTETVTDSTAMHQFEDALRDSCSEVWIDTLSKVMTTDEYAEIAGKEFTAYTDDNMRIFLAECYFTAAKFLRNWCLRNETDRYSQTFDYASKIGTTTKSGKLYSAEEFHRMGISYLSEIQNTNSIPGRLIQYIGLK